MKQLLLAGTIATVGAGILIIADQRRQATFRPTARQVAEIPTYSKSSVHAAGRIEGQTESILIRPHFPGRVETISVSRGAAVKRGQELFRLETRRYQAQRDLAKASLSAAQARKMRLEEGARGSEIEAARQDAVAAEARYESSRTRYQRAIRLFERNAVSSQDLEDFRAEHDAKLALLRAANERLGTISAAPRTADLLSADAEIASAAAQLEMAEIDLQRCRILAPRDAVVLTVDINPGEWISPEMPDAALELSNTDRLRVVADVDERDALLVAVGQSCQVTADAMPGEAFAGVIAEIEPRMEPKKIFGGWAGERTETHTGRVWIDLNNKASLPVGLPVEVTISSR